MIFDSVKTPKNAKSNSVDKLVEYVADKAEDQFKDSDKDSDLYKNISKVWGVKNMEDYGDYNLSAHDMNLLIREGTAKKKDPLHIVCAFDPNDKVDQRKIKLVVDGAMKALGMQDHQALWSYHTDTGNPHVHLVINKVHPVKKTTVTPSHDYYKLGKFADKLMDRDDFVDYRERENTCSIDKIDYRKLDDFIKRSLGEKIDSFIDDNKIENLKKLFSTNGIEVLSKGQGYVLSDGKSFVKSSKINKKLSKFLKDNPDLVAFKKTKSVNLTKNNSFSEMLQKKIGRDIKKALDKGNTKEVDKILADNNFFLKPRGQGYVISDGKYFVKASSIDRRLSKKSFDKMKKGKFNNKSPYFINKDLQEAFKNEVIDKIGFELRDALENKSIDSVEKVLADNNFFLKPRGQGYVISDGKYFVKASSIDRRMSKKNLDKLKHYSNFEKQRSVYLIELKRKRSEFYKKRKEYSSLFWDARNKLKNKGVSDLDIVTNIVNEINTVNKLEEDFKKEEKDFKKEQGHKKNWKSYVRIEPVIENSIKPNFNMSIKSSVDIAKERLEIKNINTIDPAIMNAQKNSLKPINKENER